RVHHQDRAVEQLARRPQREDRALAETRVGEAAHADAVRPGADGRAHRVLAEADHDGGLAHARGGEALEEAHEEALPPDLDQALRPPVREAEEALADGGGEEDRGHALRISASAARSRYKYARAGCTQYATRKI